MSMTYNFLAIFDTVGASMNYNLHSSFDGLHPSLCQFLPLVYRHWQTFRQGSVNCGHNEEIII